MKIYKEFGETILDIIYVAPENLLKIPLGEVSAAMELYDILKGETRGMTAEDINDKAEDNYFDNVLLEKLENLGLIKSGLVSFTINLQTEVKKLSDDELYYFLVEDLED